jgi:hypothetical protein
MANIEKRITPTGKTTYRAKIRLKGFPVQSATFDKLAAAKSWGATTEAALREGRHFKGVEAKRRTLGEALDKYIGQVLPTKPKSQGSQLHQLHWWKEKLGDYSLAEITPLLIAEKRDQLAQGKTHRTTTRAGHCSPLPSGLKSCFHHGRKRMGLVRTFTSSQGD